MPDKPDLKKAAALKYDPVVDAAPVISAVGVGQVAENIISRAVESDVPIVENTQAADILAQFSVGDAIPAELYEAIAQILVFISSADSKFSSKLRL